MAILNKISLETRFQLNNSPENFKITDTTDYASESIALSDVIGALVIVDPSGNTVHTTTLPAFDIDLDVQTYIDSIGLPTDSNGDVISGIYTITYTIRVAGAVQPGDYSKVFTYDYCYEAPDVVIATEVDLINATYKSTDNTGYPIETTSKTITHTIFPPNGADDTLFPDQVTSTKVNTYNNGKLTTKTWTSKVSTVLEITYSDGLIIDDTVVGDQEKEIVDDINLCNLQCNMRALVDRYNKALTNNPANADIIYRENLAPASINAFMYTSNIECGNFDKAEYYYNLVLEFTGASPDCACSDSDTPTLILASGSSGTGSSVVAVCSANTALTVSPVTVGDVTTYTLCFDNALYNKISALTETVITSIDGSVTISSATAGYTKTYDLSITTPSIFSGLMDISMDNKSVLPVLTWKANWSSVYGGKLIEPRITSEQGTLNNFLANPACFYMDNYKGATSGGEYPKALVALAEGTILVGKGREAVIRSSDSSLYDVVVYKLDKVNDRIYFKFISKTGFPITGKTLQQYFNKATLTVTINA